MMPQKTLGNYLDMVRLEYSQSQNQRGNIDVNMKPKNKNFQGYKHMNNTNHNVGQRTVEMLKSSGSGNIFVIIIFSHDTV